MAKYANKVVEQAKSWLGCKESNGTHKPIIDLYNAHKPLARNYKVKYTDEWCATFVSAVAIKLGYTDIIPTECGCQPMVELFQKLGAWAESDSRTPNPGDVIFYDWEDSGKGENTGRPNHVGIVEKVTGDTITVIEGNYYESVKRRNIKVNGKYIRGYGVPKYDAVPKPAPTPKPEPNPKLPDVSYRVYTGTSGWLPDVLNDTDYAGLPGQPIRCMYASLTEGDIEYQVHTLSGRWLPWVKNRDDYAGVYWSEADCVRVRLVGNPDYSIQCRVAPVRGDYFPWVTDDNDYAGVYGKKIDRLQLRIVKKK
jgi:hypothetical protein